jgi:histidine triad (HIT) family protein
MDCEFCDIIARRKSSSIVYENDRVIVFKDIHPQAKIHLQVCPKTHYPTFLDTPSEEIEYLFKVCRKLAEKLGIENGFRMTINNGPQGGQIIYHLHIHFMSWIKNLDREKIEIEVD